MKKILTLCAAVGMFLAIPELTAQGLLLLGGFFLLWSGLIQLLAREPLIRGSEGESYVSCLLLEAGCMSPRPTVRARRASLGRARIAELNKV